jgi:hypothetical protein
MRTRPLLAVSLALVFNCAAAEHAVETTIHLAIPKEIAAQASTPVLHLDGVQVRADERLTIEVLGPRDPHTKTRPILAVAGQVGSTPDPNARMESVNLVIPLNEKASRLFAKRSEITLTLRLRDAEGRAALKVKRAYLRAGE